MAAPAVAAALIAAACGGSDAGTAVESSAPASADPTSAAAEPEPTAPEPESAADEPVAEPSDDPAEPTASTSEAEPEVAAGPNDLPAVVVDDVLNGTTVDLSSFAPADRPIVVWFWAPH